MKVISREVADANITRIISCVGLLTFFIVVSLQADNDQNPAASTANRLGQMKVCRRVYSWIPVSVRPEYSKELSRGSSCVSQMDLRDGWEMAEADDRLPPGTYGPSTKWMPVTIPTSVHLALLKAGKIPNLWYGNNFKQLQWIQKKDWNFRRHLKIPEECSGCTIRLRFDGMDYVGLVWLNGVFLGSHEGMGGGPTFDITSQATPGREHELLVRLVHEDHVLDVYRALAVKADSVDGADSVWWGNLYRTIGLYQPVRLVTTGQAYLEAPFVRTERVADAAAQLWAQAMVMNHGPAFRGVIEGKIVNLSNNQTVWQETQKQAVPEGRSYWEKQIELKSPLLWWPNGMGAQSLYRLDLKLLNDNKKLDSIRSRFGVRTLELRRNPATTATPRSVFARPGFVVELQDPESMKLHAEWTELADEGYRYLWVVNGRPFYGKGVSWMTPDDVLELTPQREEWLFRAAKLSGINLIRLNGATSLFETESFYNRCDENGIVVWQELPLNGDISHGAPMEVWREQLTQSVIRIRQHPSIGVYVGGNEFDPYVDGVSSILGIAREIFAAYNHQVPFRMAAPFGGDVHAYAPWTIYSADPNWYHKIYNRARNFVSEWSFPSFANMSLLKRIIPAEELDTEPVGSDYQKFIDAHPLIRDRFTQIKDVGPLNWNRASLYSDLRKADIPTLIENSQMAQADLYGYVMEQWRAQFPYTGGETVWTFNSMGPSSSWNIIDWFGQPLMSYYFVKRAFEPVHVMADTGFFSWGPGDNFKVSIFALNDEEKPLHNVTITARIVGGDLLPRLLDTWKTNVPERGYKSSDHELTWPIPSDMPEGYFFLELTLTDEQSIQRSQQVYWLRVLQSLADPVARQRWQSAPVPEPLTTKGPWLKPQISAVSTSLQAKSASCQKTPVEAEITVTVRNIGSHAAYPVRLDVSPEKYSVLWSDDYFWLKPGEETMVKGIVRMNMAGLDPVTRPEIAKLKDLRVHISAWNTQVISLNAHP